METTRLPVSALVILCNVVLCVYLCADSKNNEKSNLELRKDAFEFLFSEYIPDRECVWNLDQLCEVEIFDRRESRIELENEKQFIALPAETERVARFFDDIVIRGLRLDEIQAAKLKLGKKCFELHVVRVEKDGQEAYLRVPALPLSINQRSGQLALVINKRVTVERVVLRTDTPFGIDAFEAYQLRRTELAKQRGEQAFVAYQNLLMKIDQLGVEKLAESLREKSEEFARSIVPAQLTAGVDIISINGFLVDRRVSKMYEVLSRMDAGDAAELAATNFRNELKRFKEDWKGAGILPARKRYAVEALLFLSSEFCSTEQFLEQLDEWHDWYHREKNDRGFQFQRQGRPDFLLVANLYCNIFVRQNEMSIEEANRWLANTVGPELSRGSNPPKLEQRWLPSSDSIPGGVDLIADVPTFQSFGAVRGREKQNRVLAVLRSGILGN